MSQHLQWSDCSWNYHCWPRNLNNIQQTFCLGWTLEAAKAAAATQTAARLNTHLVRKHGPRNHVANGKNALDVGAELVVHLDAATFVHLDAHLLQAYVLGEWATP